MWQARKYITTKVDITNYERVSDEPTYLQFLGVQYVLVAQNKDLLPVLQRRLNVLHWV